MFGGSVILRGLYVSKSGATPCSSLVCGCQKCVALISTPFICTLKSQLLGRARVCVWSAGYILHTLTMLERTGCQPESVIHVPTVAIVASRKQNRSGVLMKATIHSPIPTPDPPITHLLPAIRLLTCTGSRRILSAPEERWLPVYFFRRLSFGVIGSAVLKGRSGPLCGRVLGGCLQGGTLRAMNHPGVSNRTKRPCLRGMARVGFGRTCSVQCALGRHQSRPQHGWSDW